MTNSERKYIAVYTPSFRSDLHELTAIEVKTVIKAVDLLEIDPKHPSLRTKKLEGSSDAYESSVNMDIRLLWEFDEGKIILMLEVGHHDVLKKY